MSGAHAHPQVARDQEHEDFIDVGKVREVFGVPGVFERPLPHGLLVNGQRDQDVDFRARQVIDNRFQCAHRKVACSAVDLTPLDVPRFLLDVHHIDLVCLRLVGPFHNGPIDLGFAGLLNGRLYQIGRTVEYGRCFPEHAVVLEHLNEDFSANPVGVAATESDGCWFFFGSHSWAQS